VDHCLLCRLGQRWMRSQAEQVRGDSQATSFPIPRDDRFDIEALITLGAESNGIDL
jgi:hypothetical protein